MTENYDIDYNAGWSRYKAIVKGYAPQRQEGTGEVMVKLLGHPEVIVEKVD